MSLDKAILHGKENGERRMRLINADEVLEAEFTIEQDGAIACVVDSEVIRRAPAINAVPIVFMHWTLKDEKGNGVCSNCNRQDRIDSIATHCRYCGAQIEEKE